MLRLQILATTLAVATSGLLLSVDAHAVEDMLGEDGIVTLVTLHPDGKRRRLYAANYLMDGKIPVCSAVRLKKFNGKKLVFTVADTGVTYTYLTHKSLRESFGEHLDRIFGRKCPDAEMAKLNDKDKKGIKKGRAIRGMTRKGVLFAVGYPPEHETPDLEDDRWKYWRNRFNTMVVHFNDKGIVSRVQE